MTTRSTQTVTEVKTVEITRDRRGRVLKEVTTITRTDVIDQPSSEG